MGGCLGRRLATEEGCRGRGAVEARVRQQLVERRSTHLAGASSLGAVVGPQRTYVMDSVTGVLMNLFVDGFFDGHYAVVFHNFSRISADASVERARTGLNSCVAHTMERTQSIIVYLSIVLLSKLVKNCLGLNRLLRRTPQPEYPRAAEPQSRRAGELVSPRAGEAREAGERTADSPNSESRKARVPENHKLGKLDSWTHGELESRRSRAEGRCGAVHETRTAGASSRVPEPQSSGAARRWVPRS